VPGGEAVWTGPISLGRRPFGQVRYADPKALTEDRQGAGDLHRPEPGQAGQPIAQVPAVAGLAPDAAGVVAVLAGDDGAQGLDLAGHRAGEAVDGGRRPEDPVEVHGRHRRDLRGVEVAEPLTQDVGARESLLDGDLLVEGEADEEGEGLVDEVAIGGVVAGERQAVGGL
jgi:hypothetical protein